jgi:hypothetical protein
VKNNNAIVSASKWLAPLCATLLLAAGQAQAASISYFIDQSNLLPDGVNYLQVTISEGDDGAIDFMVEALPPLLALAGENFGIQSFAFNIVPGGDAEAAWVTNLTPGWRARDHRRMSSFGFFDIKLSGGGQGRLDTLTFSIEGIDGDIPSDYAVLSTGQGAGGNQMFAAHVAGFDLECLDSKDDKKCKTSAFFGGSSAVPLPATAWLFATGIVGAAVRARRRRVSNR